MSILDTIVKRKKEEVSERKKSISASQLVQSENFERKCFSLSKFVLNPQFSGIISEFKRKSPSKPAINLEADVVKITSGYEKAASSGVSILTDIDFFGGNDLDLFNSRLHLNIPILRKDFMIDEYQIIEAKSIGADAILLISEILSKEEINHLSKVAVDLGMDVLMEIHTADQLEKYHDRIQLIGVNNRNLKTFTTDIQYSIDLFPQLPESAVKISESGIDNVDFVIKLKKIGYQGFLIGENFMKSNDPGFACKNFIDEIRAKS